MSGFGNSSAEFLSLQLAFSLKLCLHDGLCKFLFLFLSYCSKKWYVSQNFSYFYLFLKKKKKVSLLTVVFQFKNTILVT